MFRLTDDDGRMIDLVLDCNGSDKPPSNGAARRVLPLSDGPGSEQLAQRLACAERLFSLLAALPADDPPGNLLNRTIESVQAFTRGQPGPAAQIRPDLANPIAPQL